MNVPWTRRPTCAGLLLVLALSAGAAEPKHAPLVLKDPIQDKNFYLLSLIEQTPAARNLVKSSAPLAEIAAAKRSALSNGVKCCAADVACYTNAVRWSDEEIARTSAALGALAEDSSMRQFVEGPVLQPGMYQRYSQGAPAALLEKAWGDAARKMNLAIDVYASANPARITSTAQPMM